MSPRIGDVWDVNMPFKDDPAQRKYRPCVVLGASPTGPNEDAVVLVVMITSFGKGGQPRNGDVLVKNERLAGLNRRSWVRARRLFSADMAAFDPSRHYRRGYLDNDTLDEVLDIVEDLLAP